MISDDDDSFISDAETEGGFGDNNAGISSGPPSPASSGGALPNEGAFSWDNFATDGEGRRRSTRTRDPIDRLVPGANNVMPDADGKLDRFNLWTVRQSIRELAN